MSHPFCGSSGGLYLPITGQYQLRRGRDGGTVSRWDAGSAEGKNPAGRRQCSYRCRLNGIVTALAASAAGCSQIVMTDVQQLKLDLVAKLGPI